MASVAELKELIKDLADDAGYNLMDPPSHYCTAEDKNLSQSFCLTCDVWKRIKKLKLKWE